ncbi:MAG: hypothetical protein AAF823_14180 [Planctomycetota bacterium]
MTREPRQLGLLNRSQGASRRPGATSLHSSFAHHEARPKAPKTCSICASLTNCPQADPDAKARVLRTLLRDCAAGFYQQMYFLGKDVVHDRGNQLKDFGFVRTPTRGTEGTSCYTLEHDAQTIELYGSCACCYAHAASVAFIRTRCRFYGWLPQDRCVAGLWEEDDLEVTAPEAMFESVKPLLHWWLDYEAWVGQRHGHTYRQLCFEEWRKVNKRRSWLPPQDALRWVDEFLTKGCAHCRPDKAQAKPSN